MFAGGGEGEEADIPVGVPTSAQALLHICCLSGWISGGGGDSNPEKVSQLPGHQVAATLLEDMMVRALVWEY